MIGSTFESWLSVTLATFLDIVVIAATGQESRVAAGECPAWEKGARLQ